jgi:signal transduction histidine kinase
MPAFRNLSMQWKLLWVSMLASGTTLLLVCAAFVFYDLVTFREAMVRQLAGQAEVIGSNSASALLFDDVDAATETLEALRAEPRIIAAGIYRADGRQFATYTRQASLEASLLPAQLGGAPNGHRFADEHLVLFRPIIGGKQAVGTVYIMADLHEVQQRLTRYLGIASLVGLVSFIFALVISSWLQRRISRPLQDLARTARLVSAEKNYTVQVAAVDSRDEVGVLVQAFNEMLTQIRWRDTALQQAHDELERRVIERTAQLEAANQELEAFSYSISHDLRAPLRAINGFARILLEEHAPHMTDAAREYLDLVRDNAQQMGQLIDDLLAFSRLSRLPLSKQLVAPADLVQQARSDLRPMQEGRRVNFTLGALPLCQADPALLKQVFVNLLANALKFTGRREVAVIEVGCREVQGEHVYFVKDNGVGFNMAYANKLFGVFQRLHPTEEYDGTGVGLAIVQRIIHRHGGRVWAEAGVDQGATFSFTLEGDTGHA